MRLQKTNYTCGPASIVNALKIYGVNVGEKRVEQLSGCNTKDGTQNEEMLDAIEKLGFEGHFYQTFESSEALEELQYQLCDSPAILLVANGRHWVTCIGMGPQDTFIIADPAISQKNKNENGIKMLNCEQLIEWMYSKVEGYVQIYVRPQ